MKIKLIIAALLSSTCLLATTGYAVEPRNLDFTKKDLMQYQASGAYAKDIKTVADQALAYLKTRANSSHNKPLAIVLDIDDTSLSNYPDLVKLRFGGTLEDMGREMAKATDPVIEPTLALYRYAKAHKIAVFFITGRTQNMSEFTVKNLLAAGYADWDDLIYKPEHYNEKSVVAYKAGARKKITEQGYDIVLTMGDQLSDINGGYADKGYKLSNPYYFIP